jgi:hypothetical protein
MDGETKAPGDPVAGPPGASGQARVGRCRLCLRVFLVVDRPGRGRQQGEEFCRAGHRHAWWSMYHPRIYNKEAGDAAAERWRKGEVVGEYRTRRKTSPVEREIHNRQEKARKARRKAGLKAFEGTKWERLAKGEVTRRRPQAPRYVPTPDDPAPLNMDCALCRIGGIPCRMHQ